MWPVKRVVPILFVMLCLGGCSLSEHLTRVSSRIEEMYTNTREWSSLPLRKITWHQAVTMMKENNLELKEIDDQIAYAERQSLSIYTDMIPGVSYYGYMTRSISQLSRPMNSNELTSNINVTFSLPALTRVPYDVYAAKVRTFAAVKAKEGRQRELVSKLYQLVRQREVEDARRALAAEQPMDQQDIKTQASAEQTDERYWQDLSRLLGNREARWSILPESMPHVQWESYNPRLDRLGELVVCQFAMRLEQARMAQYGVALSYLPTINTSLYSPSLFSSTGGTYSGTFLNGDDTRLNLSISYSLDTHLNTWDLYQQSKARYEREKTKVVDELMDHKNKVATLRKSMQQYMQWRSYMFKRMDYLRKITPPDADGYVERTKAIYGIRQELLNQENNAIEGEAALVLEYGMPDEPERTTTTPAP